MGDNHLKGRAFPSRRVARAAAGQSALGIANRAHPLTRQPVPDRMPTSSKKKPLVIVTRKLPEAIETRLMELFETSR
jgi:hypothetical protein